MARALTGVKALQNEIERKGSLVISDGTMRNSDLLEAMVDLVQAYDLRPEWRKEAERLVYGDNEVPAPPEEALNDWDGECFDQAIILIHEEAWPYLDEIAAGIDADFGCHPGDGALVGFFYEGVLK